MGGGGVVSWRPATFIVKKKIHVFIIYKYAFSLLLTIESGYYLQFIQCVLGSFNKATKMSDFQETHPTTFL